MKVDLIERPPGSGYFQVRGLDELFLAINSLPPEFAARVVLLREELHTALSPFIGKKISTESLRAMTSAIERVVLRFEEEGWPRP